MRWELSCGHVVDALEHDGLRESTDEHQGSRVDGAGMTTYETAAIQVHDLVRVADGRVGTVTGFFRCDEEAVLVSFADEGCERFPLAAVDLAVRVRTRYPTLPQRAQRRTVISMTR